MLLRLVLLVLSAGLILGLAGMVRADVSPGTAHAEHHGAPASGSDAAGPSETAPDLDTGGEVVLPLLVLAGPVDPPRPAPPAHAAPLSVGRLHAVRLFRPPRTTTLR